MMVTASATARAATGLAHRLALRNERRSLWAALEPSVSSHLGTLAISRTAAAPPPPCGARRWLAAASAPSTRRILKDGDATVVAVPPNLKIDPRSTCSPFYGLEKVTPEKKSRRINKRGEDGATCEAGGEAKTEAVEDVSEDELVDELVEDNDYDDEEEEDRILYDLTTRPEPYQAVPLPERLRVPVFALQTGEEVGSIHLSDKTFGCDPIRTDILHRVVIYQRNKKRGKRKAKTKTISEVSGSGRKVRQQKGSGMARAGHRRPAHWRGGAKAHGPKGSIQDYTTKLNKKVRRMGMRHALSQKLKEGSLVVFSDMNVDTHKTKALAAVLDQFDVGGRYGTTAFLVDHPDDEAVDAAAEEEADGSTAFVGGINVNLRVASGNIFKVKVVNQQGANVYDILKHEKLFLSLPAVLALEERLERDM